jgi:fructose-1,6-bisphosphatase I
MDIIHLIPHRYPTAEYLLVYDPVDGSRNIDVNLSVGTVFSVLEAPEGASTRDVQEEDSLQPGSRQVAAGYAVYGPQTSLVLTFGKGVFGFTLDREVGSWVLTQLNTIIPGGLHDRVAVVMGARDEVEAFQSYGSAKNGTRPVTGGPSWPKSAM